MIERWMWSGGHLRRVLARGIPFGVILWLVQTPEGPLWASLISLVVVSGGLFGLLMSFLEQRQSPLLAGLDPADRMEVLDAVRDGRRVADARLAPAVVERAALWRKSIGTAARDRWILAAIAVGATGWGIVLVSDGDVRPAVLFWILAGLSFVLAIVGPGRANARLAQADEAGHYAREML